MEKPCPLEQLVTYYAHDLPEIPDDAIAYPNSGPVPIRELTLEQCLLWRGNGTYKFHVSEGEHATEIKGMCTRINCEGPLTVECARVALYFARYGNHGVNVYATKI